MTLVTRYLVFAGGLLVIGFSRGAWVRSAGVALNARAPSMSLSRDVLNGIRPAQTRRVRARPGDRRPAARAEHPRGAPKSRPVTVHCGMCKGQRGGRLLTLIKNAKKGPNG